MDNRPLIFITNDDSTSAPGLRVLIEIMQRLGDVFVISPQGLQSGQSHAVTVNDPIRHALIKADGRAFNEYSCSGTPVDCVKIGLKVLLKETPDLLVSGINHGSNASINMLYSGTMAAAMEGALEGIPSIGFSLCEYGWNASFEHAKEPIYKIAKKVLENGLPDGTALNVNIPAISNEPLKGIKSCYQAQGRWSEDFDSRIDPRKQPYHWIKGKFVHDGLTEGSDLHALENNYISVVPVQTDFTNYQALDLMEGDFDED